MSDLGNKSIFASNLYYYMEKKHIDRYQLCEALEFKYSTLCEWLSARKYPRIDKIEKLANYFGVPKSALIEKSSESDTTDSPDMVMQLSTAQKELFDLWAAIPQDKLDSLKCLAELTDKELEEVASYARYLRDKRSE